MKIQCPLCKKAVPTDQVNMAKDLAFCPACSQAFKISESVDLDSVNSEVIRNPPEGAWYRNEMDRIVLGATTRSPMAFFFVPFTCVWAGGSLGGIYGSQIIRGEFDLRLSLFGIPFLFGSLMLISLSLMSIWGKVEVSIGRQSSVFTGIGNLGWTRKFDWAGMNSVREGVVYGNTHHDGGHQASIVLEGKDRLSFGTGLNEKRRYFLINALKYLKSQSR